MAFRTPTPLKSTDLQFGHCLENIAFFLAHTSGVICVPLLPERADALDLPLMVTANTEAQRTAFTVSVDYRHGTTTGISATDRASTIGALIDPATRPTDVAATSCFIGDFFSVPASTSASSASASATAAPVIAAVRVPPSA